MTANKLECKIIYYCAGALDGNNIVQYHVVPGAELAEAVCETVDAHQVGRGGDSVRLRSAALKDSVGFDVVYALSDSIGPMIKINIIIVWPYYYYDDSPCHRHCHARCADSSPLRTTAYYTHYSLPARQSTSYKI